MKMKSFAMLASSGLLAGYIAYITPAMADYTNASNPSMQQSNPADNAGQNMADPNNTSNSDQNMNDNSNNNSSNNNSDQQGTPDTATGDDDY